MFLNYLSFFLSLPCLLLLVGRQLQLELATVVHVVVVVARVVGVQDNLLAALRARVKEQVQAQRKVVEEVVAAPMLRPAVRIRRMDLHLVLALEEDAIRAAQAARHVLARVAEHHLARYSLLARLQHAHRALCVKLQADALGAARVPQDLHRVHVQLLVVAGEGQCGRDTCLCGIAAAVQRHLGHDWRGAIGKVQRAQAVGISRLQFAVHRKVEAEPAKVQGKQLLRGIVDTRVCGAERVLDLFDGGRHFRRAEGEATGSIEKQWVEVNGYFDCDVSINLPVLELDELHVKHLDALHALHDGVKDQPDAILGQIYHYIHAQGVL